MDASNIFLCDKVGEDSCDSLKNDALQDNALLGDSRHGEEGGKQKTISTIDDDATTFDEKNDQPLTDKTTTQQLYHCAAINCPRVFHSSTDRDRHVCETGHNGLKSCLSSTRNKRLRVFNDNLTVYQNHAYHEPDLLDPPSQCLPNSNPSESNLLDSHRLDSHLLDSPLLDPQKPHLPAHQLAVDNSPEQPQSSHITFRCYWTAKCTYETVVESTYNAHLKEHLKNHLMSQLEKGNRTESNRSNGHESKQIIKLYHKCTDCGSSYSRSEHLVRHVRVQHSGPMPCNSLYRCTWKPDCRFSSGTRTGMINHLRVHLSRDSANAHFDDDGRIVWSKYFDNISD